MLVKDHVISDVASRRYTIKFAKTEEEVEAAQRLRYNIFKGELDRNFIFENGIDRDKYDDQAHHLIVVHNESGSIIGTYRLQSYEQAQSGKGFTTDVRFRLNNLPEDVLKNAVEVGRACISEEHRSGRVLFLLWKGLAGYLEHFKKRYLFGYAALESKKPHVALQTLEHLEKENILHPEYHIEPREGYELEWNDDMPRTDEIDIPPLFQNYIDVGCTVCGGPSYDRDLNLLHFVILLDVEAISDETRKLFFG
ncbi:GNAT family N-acetyltransferase [Rhodohalobacter sulfatireducens]|uniref:GNAT family N-acetyltransferase n=1 Tax=Rhodohalobacter sulfatireducens TaxID=2911366 RepID=A0ABS9K854_9BACT|nr:GNAT family N-acyltransferase [Rhodohalobacter sulfatireducens]MCG2587034.1 GNAT family N-acetyltransferase [Rhodohalobacter sulfatireducens]